MPILCGFAGMKVVYCNKSTTNFCCIIRDNTEYYVVDTEESN